MYEIKKSMFVLKSSLAKKDDKLNSSTTDLHGHKEAYFHPKHKNADDKLLAKFDAYQKVAEWSKSEVVVETYKLGYLVFKSGVVPCYFIKDENVEMFCSNMPLNQDVQINAEIWRQPKSRWLMRQ